MKIALGIIAGITATMLAYIVWQPAIDRRDISRVIAWIFTHNQPDTHPDSRPKYRTWHNGTITEGPW